MTSAIASLVPTGVRVLVVGGFLLAMSTSIAAQSPTASLTGQVTDESGSILPGVTVTATSPALQVPQITAITDVRGEYRLTPLPIGTYDVRYELTGFQSVERKDVRLTIGFVAKIDIAMKIATFAEAITVSGQSPTVDVTTSTPRTQFLRETLEELPTTRNGILSVLIVSPGVRPDASKIDVGGSQFTTQPTYNNFGRSGDQWVTNDGVLTTSANGTPEGVYWDFASFEEVAISTVGGGAEMPGSGVSLNSIVKSGGNSFHGGGSFMKTGPWAQADNIDADQAARGATGGNSLLQRYDANADIGGRIIRDRLWFYGSARRAKDDVEVAGLFKPDGTPGNLPKIQTFATAKLSMQLTNSQKLIGYYQYNAKWTYIGLTNLIDWNSKTVQDQKGYTDKIEWQGIFGKALTISAHYGYYIYDAPIDGEHRGQVATFDAVTLRWAGDSLPTSASATGSTPLIADQYRHQAHAAMTYYTSNLWRGNHTFKAGFDYSPATFDWDYLSRGISGDYYLRFRSGVPFQLATINTPVHTINDAIYTGGFVQDDWSLRRLTLSLGIRYDRNNGYIPESTRVDGPFAKAATFPEVQFAIWNAVAPRVHFAYDMTGNGKTAIKGGWGRFNKMRFTNEISPANNSISTHTFYTWHDLNGNKLYEPGEVNLDLSGPDFVSLNGGSTRVANAAELQPKVDEFSLNLEHELMPNFSVRVTGVYTREFNLRRLVGVYRPYESYNIPVTNLDPGPDGRLGTPDDPGTRLTYYEYPVALQPAKFQTVTPVTDPDLTNTYKAFEVSASKRLSHNWQMMGTFGLNWVNLPVGGDLVAATPNAEIFATRNTRDWYGKLGGSYRFTAPGILASANLTAVSGQPYARTVLFTGGQTITSIVLPVEPIGTERYPDAYLLDLRAEKTVQFAGQKLALRADLFNTLNANPVITQTIQSGASFQRPTAIMPARIAVFGVTYTF
jgi:hypothetical protein